MWSGKTLGVLSAGWTELPNLSFLLLAPTLLVLRLRSSPLYLFLAQGAAGFTVPMWIYNSSGDNGNSNGNLSSAFAATTSCTPAAATTASATASNTTNDRSSSKSTSSSKSKNKNKVHAVGYRSFVFCSLLRLKQSHGVLYPLFVGWCWSVWCSHQTGKVVLAWNRPHC